MRKIKINKERVITQSLKMSDPRKKTCFVNKKVIILNKTVVTDGDLLLSVWDT